MKMTNMFGKEVAAALVAAGMLATPIWAQANANDQQLQAEVQRSLDSGKYSGVHVTAANSVVTLTGSVDRLADKLDAEKKARKVKHVASVNDQIRVAGESVSDAELTQKLGTALIYTGQGYGDVTFNALTLQVHDGVATVGGVVVQPIDKENAINLVKNTKGVRGLVDRIQVAPLSPADDRVRFDTARAVYGAAQLNRYALDPAKPIRISVVNGHVTLTGVVDSAADKNVAFLRANGVPGAFSVTNDLLVRGQQPEQ